ncbi:MAG TPA: glycosyltransferase family 2 protein [Gemmatimonadales bacterium]
MADLSSPARPAPTVTIIIPMRNERENIATCLASVLASDLPAMGTIEVLVLDGASTDGSDEIVRRIAVEDPRVQLLDNPDRLQAAAFNRGLAAARGDFVVRMDAHSSYAADYVAECVRLLEETGAGNVGGVQRAHGTTWVTRAIAAAVSSPFAAGDAKYRNATAPAFTDTVYLGAWRTTTLRELGGMRTDWAVNEDYEMNIRLRARGDTVYLSPTIRSTYQVRGTLPKLARQYARYGFWKVRTLLEHRTSIRWRQLVAPTFVLSVILTPWLVAHLGVLGAAHLVAYAAVSVLASTRIASKQGLALLPILPIVFLVIHLAWGIGFWAGLAYWPMRHERQGRG